MRRTGFSAPPNDGRAAHSAEGGRILRIHRALFVRRPLSCLIVAVGAYASTILVFGDALAISSNYFVLVPILVASLCYGFLGGLVSGALGLPANLALFAILGHPEFSPASKLIAELSGLFVGSTLGYLAEYFRRLESEIERRIRVEESLIDSLEANRLLLRELHHRVKNNLNVIKSLIVLQKSRSTNREFIEASDALLGRVFAIARAHDRLYGSGDSGEVDPRELLADILNTFPGELEGGPRIDSRLDTGDGRLPADLAIPLGLVVNEIVSNALKHAPSSGDQAPRILVRLSLEDSSWKLLIRDNGSGFDPRTATGPGLGIKIVRGLVGQLKGRASWSTEGGSVFRLEFPCQQEKEPPGGERAPSVGD